MHRYELVLFVSGPYRNTSDNRKFGNICHARDIAKHLWNNGFTAFCPHTNSLLMDDCKDSDKIFLLGDITILKRCDAIVMAPGWYFSEGATSEHKMAKELGLPIFYWSDVDCLEQLRAWSDECLNSKSQKSKSARIVLEKILSDWMNLPLVLGSTVFFTLLWSIRARRRLLQANEDSEHTWSSGATIYK